MYQVNLLSWRVLAEHQRYRLWLYWRIIHLLAAGVLLFTAFFLLRWQHQQLRQTLPKLTQQHHTWMKRLDKKQEQIKVLTQLKIERALQSQNEQNNQGYFQLLQQLSLTIPDDVWLTLLEEREHTLFLQGMSQYDTQILLFEQRLSHLLLLRNVHLVEVVKQADGVLAFTLTAKWER